MQRIISLPSHSIRTDWIHRIQRGQDKGAPTCTIWYSVGPVNFFDFKGKDAETALLALAEHPAFPA
jgi:hypothetical protein